MVGMKRKIPVTILIAMILIHMVVISTSAATNAIDLTYDLAGQTVRVQGTGLQASSPVSVQGFVNDTMDHINQTSTDESGEFIFEYPSNGFEEGDVIKVVIGGAGLDTPITVEKTVAAQVQVRYQETDENLHFAGSWTNRSLPAFDGEKAKQTSKQGDTLTFTFKGTGFGIVSYKSYSQGMLDVYVDNVLQENRIDLYEPSADASFQQTVYEDYSWNDGKAHTVKLVVNGKNPLSVGYNVYIDAVAIAGEFIVQSGLNDDKAIVAGNTNPVIIDVLANDETDSKGIRIESGPANGTAEVKDGYVVYTPVTMLQENDAFTYSVEGQSGTAAVTVEYGSPMLYQEDYRAITAEGWSTYSFYRYNDGKAAVTKNGTMSFTFEGDRLEIIGYKSKSRGVFYVTVDGGAPVRVSCYDNSYDTWFGTVYEAENLGEGAHTAEIRVTGEKDAAALGTQVDIDAIRTFK